MSYSFGVKGPNKTAARAAAEKRLDEEIKEQPAHTRDRAQALANVDAHLALVSDPLSTEEVHIGMHGAIVFNGNDGRVVHAGSGCTIGIVAVTNA